MIVYEVFVNEQPTRAGARDQTSLSLRLNAGDAASGAKLSVAAFRVSGTGHLEKHWQWHFPPLRIGDEVRVRILETDVVDPPTKVDDSQPELTPDEKSLAKREILRIKRFTATLAQRGREPANEDTTHCSFCGRSHDEVRRLIAGPSVFICNECVAACVELQESEP